MTKDELMRMTMYEAPPENLELAQQRLQILWARDILPQSKEEAQEKINMAGPYPSNLDDVVFKNVDQFLTCVKDMHDGEGRPYSANAEVIADGGRKKIWAGRAYTKDNSFFFLIEELPYKARVLMARTQKVPKKHQKWLDAVNEVLYDNADRPFAELG